MSLSEKNQTQKLITADEVVKILNCSRTNIERLQLKGLLKAVPTIHPKYYFEESQVMELKKSLTSKKRVKL